MFISIRSIKVLLVAFQFEDERFSHDTFFEFLNFDYSFEDTSFRDNSYSVGYLSNRLFRTEFDQSDNDGGDTLTNTPYINSDSSGATFPSHASEIPGSEIASDVHPNFAVSSPVSFAISGPTATERDAVGHEHLFNTLPAANSAEGPRFPEVAVAHTDYGTNQHSCHHCNKTFSRLCELKYVTPPFCRNAFLVMIGMWTDLTPYRTEPMVKPTRGPSNATCEIARSKALGTRRTSTDMSGRNMAKDLRSSVLLSSVDTLQDMGISLSGGPITYAGT